MAQARTILSGLMLAAAALTADAAPITTPSISRSTMTVMKPDFTRPGGQPGAVREIAPAKPKANRRGRSQTPTP